MFGYQKQTATRYSRKQLPTATFYAHHEAGKPIVAIYLLCFKPNQKEEAGRKRKDKMTFSRLVRRQTAPEPEDLKQKRERANSTECLGGQGTAIVFLPGVIFTGDCELEGWELHRCTSSADLIKGGALLQKCVEEDMEEFSGYYSIVEEEDSMFGWFDEEMDYF